MRRLWLLVGICLVPVAGSAQTLSNPRSVIFTCPDHAQDDQHEIDIVRVSDGVVVATILGGDPPATTAGDVVIPVNVQPVAFGSYRFVARAVAGTLKSANSAPSPTWNRVPGEPTNVRGQ